MPEIETQNRRDLVRITQLICNSFRTSTHPDIVTPLLCSYYKVHAIAPSRLCPSHKVLLIRKVLVFQNPMNGDFSISRCWYEANVVGI